MRITAQFDRTYATNFLGELARLSSQPIERVLRTEDELLQLRHQLSELDGQINAAQQPKPRHH